MSSNKKLEEFDPQQWADSSAESKKRPGNETGAVVIQETDLKADIQRVVDWLISRRIDITQGYDNWMRLGFALSDGLGKAGRDLFHQLSSMNEGYNPTECDKQYTNCLHGKREGVTVRTFFHMAGEAGFDLRALALEKVAGKLPPEPWGEGGADAYFADFANPQLYPEMYKIDNSLNINDDYISTSTDAAAQTAETAKNSYGRRSDQQPLATFSDKIPLDKWPHLIRDVMEPMRTHEAKDKMVLSSLTVVSGIIHNYYTIYRRKTVFPPIYLIIWGPTASGKGEVAFCVLLIQYVTKEIEGEWRQDMEEYQKKHDEWERMGKTAAGRAQRGPEPQEPPFRTPIIPANSSATAAYQALEANGGSGIMFETEGSTMPDNYKSEHGNYVNGVEKAFHHEPIKLRRVRDKLYIYIENPRLAICMTGTGDMMCKLFQYQEQGLCNRFLYYGLSTKLEWDSPFLQEELPLDQYYEELGRVVLDIYHQMKRLGRRIQFMLTATQQQEFDQFFSELLVEQHMLSDNEFVYRLGLNAIRIAMTLALLRRYDECKGEHPMFQDDEQALICPDDDFRIMMTIVNTLVNHSMKVYATFGKRNLKSDNPQLARLKAQELRLFEALGEEFTTIQLNMKAEELGMNVKTVQRYLSNYINRYEVAVRVKNGLFRKVTSQQ